MDKLDWQGEVGERVGKGGHGDGGARLAGATPQVAAQPLGRRQVAAREWGGADSEEEEARGRWRGVRLPKMDKGCPYIAKLLGFGG